MAFPMAIQPPKHSTMASAALQEWVWHRGSRVQPKPYVKPELLQTSPKPYCSRAWAKATLKAPTEASINKHGPKQP
jgi:hypothetical protein